MGDTGHASKTRPASCRTLPAAKRVRRLGGLRPARDHPSAHGIAIVAELARERSNADHRDHEEENRQDYAVEMKRSKHPLEMMCPPIRTRPVPDKVSTATCSGTVRSLRSTAIFVGVPLTAATCGKSATRPLPPQSPSPQPIEKERDDGAIGHRQSDATEEAGEAECGIPHCARQDTALLTSRPSMSM